MDEYNKDFCNERHDNIDKSLGSISNNVQKLFDRLDKFYIVAIGTLMTGVLTGVVSILVVLLKNGV